MVHRRRPKRAQETPTQYHNIHHNKAHPDFSVQSIQHKSDPGAGHGADLRAGGPCGQDRADAAGFLHPHQELGRPGGGVQEVA